MTADQKQKMKVKIGHCVLHHDGPEILRIEKASFVYPWEKWEFIKQCNLRNGVALVARIDDRVAGYMFLVLSKTNIEIVNLAVVAGDQYRRHGIGRQLVEKACNKIKRGKRDHVAAAVRETNLSAQCFFKAMEFKAVDVVRDYYDQSDESLYWFVFKPKDTHPFVPRNRLKWRSSYASDV